MGQRYQIKLTKNTTSVSVPGADCIGTWDLCTVRTQSLPESGLIYDEPQNGMTGSDERVFWVRRENLGNAPYRKWEPTSCPRSAHGSMREKQNTDQHARTWGSWTKPVMRAAESRKMTCVGRREWQEADKERPPKKPSFFQRLSCSFREGYIFMGLQPSLGQ